MGKNVKNRIDKNSAAAQFCAVFRQPQNYSSLSTHYRAGIITFAHHERMLGALAHHLKSHAIPVTCDEDRVLARAMHTAAQDAIAARFEAEMARRALKPAHITPILLKGAAYVAAGLKAAQGRQVGDLDILIPHNAFPPAEAALLAAGWEWAKPDPYDDAYYRQHMHELPPLIHRTRDRMIDVHHTILPPTAQQGTSAPRPDAAALIAEALAAGDVLAAGDGLAVLAPADMAIHCAAHLLADGELEGGLRNLWDFHCLLGEFAARNADYCNQLQRRANHHRLWPAVQRAARLSQTVYGTVIPPEWQSGGGMDWWYLRRLTARDGWGRPTRKFTRLAFFIRSHWLRMPPLMLARHLWVKWRKGQGDKANG